MFCHWKAKVDILQERPEPLPRCDQCRMHMQKARILKYWQSEKCHKSTYRRIQQKDVEMAARCGEMEFSLDWEEGDERVEIVPIFWYMGRPLYQTDDN